jgi:hypothetical protein
MPVRSLKDQLASTPLSKAPHGGNRHRGEGYREAEDKRTDGPPPAVVVGSRYEPHPVCNEEEQGNQKGGHRSETHAGQSVTSSGVIRVPLTLRTIIECAGALRRSVGEPGLRTHRCWNRSTCGTCVWP